MLRWTATITVVVWDGTRWCHETFPNLITDAGRNLLRDALRLAGSQDIRYLAWGDSTTPPAVGDLALGNELGRKQVTTRDATETGVTVTTTYLGPNDANVSIRELGWFGGEQATATPGSGVMLARVLYSRDKTNLESIQVQRTDTIT